MAKQVLLPILPLLLAPHGCGAWVSSGALDQDGDGHMVGLDCDDDNNRVHPGSDEYCDGLDNDCDGEVDDNAIGASTWFPDSDSDGFGYTSYSVVSCEGTDGYVEDGSDCDDNDAAVHPEADEYCNGKDDDCDGDVDEETALDASTWYADTDGDGYGDGSASIVDCEQPAGYV